MEHTLGQRIRAARKDAGLTASALASAAGVTEDAIRKVESGRSKQPSFTAGVEIARALGVSPLLLTTGLESDEVRREADILARSIWALREHRATLEAYGVRHAAIFGSVARGESDSESDIDVLLDVDSEVPFSLLTLSRIGVLLHDAVGRRADVMLERSARSQHFENILKEAIYAF